MKTVGVIGGMGPAAAADMFEKLIAATAASCDAEHVPVIIDGNTAIPDRTAAILSGGDSPLPELIRSAKRLEAAGCECIAMACNTAHYYYPAVAAAVAVPVLHMPRLAARAAKAAGIRCAAVLSTAGTAAAGVYAAAFAAEAPAIKLLPLSEEQQRAVTDMIYLGVKAGREAFPQSAFIAAVGELYDAGADAFILGCTELPIAFVRCGITLPVIDPTAETARALAAFAGAALKPRPNVEIVTHYEREKTENTFFSSLSPLRLKAIPAREKKKRIVIERVAAEVEEGRVYSAAEFTALLAPIFEDHAFLRRYLVDMGLVSRSRDGSSYIRSH